MTMPLLVKHEIRKQVQTCMSLKDVPWVYACALCADPDIGSRRWTGRARNHREAAEALGLHVQIVHPKYYRYSTRKEGFR